MTTDQHITERVAQAKKNRSAEDALIQDYMPFIRSETAKFLKRLPIDSDDELSIAMIAFHEAIHSYVEEKGSFMSLAQVTIKNRLVDNFRREKRHMDNYSMNTPVGDNGVEIGELIADDEENHDDRIIYREATKKEIEELSTQMSEFGVSLTDVAENCPQQERNKTTCLKAMQYARENNEILDEFLRTKRLPLAKLADGNKSVRKTLERHRKYLVALLLICTNGYEIIRGHLKQVMKGGAAL